MASTPGYFVYPGNPSPCKQALNGIITKMACTQHVPRDLPFSGVTDLGGLKGDTPGEGGGVGVLLSSG